MSKEKIAIEFQDVRVVFDAEGNMPDVAVEIAAVDAMGVTGWIEIEAGEDRVDHLEELLVALARGQARVYRKVVMPKEKRRGR